MARPSRLAHSVLRAERTVSSFGLSHGWPTSAGPCDVVAIGAGVSATPPEVALAKMKFNRQVSPSVPLPRPVAPPSRPRCRRTPRSGSQPRSPADSRTTLIRLHDLLLSPSCRGPEAGDDRGAIVLGRSLRRRIHGSVHTGTASVQCGLALGVRLLDQRSNAWLLGVSDCTEL